jgi:leucyl aminopeptidase
VTTLASLQVEVAPKAPAQVTLGVLTRPDGGLPESSPLDWEGLRSVGFEGVAGQTVPLPTGDGGRLLLVGIGEGDLTPNGLRDAAAAFSRATSNVGTLAFELPEGMDSATAAQMVVEGVTLARYRYDALKAKPTVTAVSELTLVTTRRAGAVKGTARGVAMSETTQIARDLANTPPALLTATAMAGVAQSLGPDRGLAVEIFDKADLIAMGCGGILGVNAGSVEPPKLVKLTYTPPGRSRATLTMVGKGIMYDAGGLALKPADIVHAAMKNDMSGAGAILAAMLNLSRLGCKAKVIGYLCCTDNRPSGSAIAMGDVLAVRGGKTVEVVNTDAEGRLVMADGLVLATEEATDAIIDIATLTGAAMRTLGTRVAAMMGNHQGIIDQLETAAAATDEPLWELPLIREYRREMSSTVADIKNLGGANAGSITAGLFLEEFVAGKPWAHIDIAGTADGAPDESWRPAGCTGFGARLLAELAVNFTKPRAEEAVR